MPDRLRQLIFEEWVAAPAPDAFEPRLQQRIVRRGKRQLVDGHDRECVAFDVNAFPKTPRGQQHRISQFAKAAEQGLPWSFALHEYRKRRLGKMRLQRTDTFGQGAVTRVQQKSPAAAGFEQ